MTVGTLPSVTSYRRTIKTVGTVGTVCTKVLWPTSYRRPHSPRPPTSYRGLPTATPWSRQRGERRRLGNGKARGATASILGIGGDRES